MRGFPPNFFYFTFFYRNFGGEPPLPPIASILSFSFSKIINNNNNIIIIIIKINNILSRESWEQLKCDIFYIIG
jgi:hypothetical protein